MKTETKVENGIVIHTNILEDSDYSTPEQKTARMNTCRQCEKYTNIISEECSECKCILETRILYIDMFCPIGKW